MTMGTLELIKVEEREGRQVVSARELYLGLGLDKSNWSRWSKQNIENNKFFISNSDWEKIEIEMVGNDTKDYMISMPFASYIINSAKSVSSRIKIEVLECLGILENVDIYSRFEINFKDFLSDLLKGMNLDFEYQKNVLNGKYRIDFYIPKYNLAIEYDEFHHTYNKGKDKQREDEIKIELSCDIIRLDYTNSDAYNCGLIINYIISKNERINKNIN